MTVSASPRGAAARVGCPGAAAAVPDDENVRVVVRVRPMNDTEKNQDYRNIVHVDTINGSIQVHSVPVTGDNFLRQGTDFQTGFS